MHSDNYKDLLEKRASLKSMKESMFRLNPKEDFSKINKSISDLSIKIREYQIDDSPTILLSEPENIVPFDFIPIPKPKLGAMSYDNFYRWNRDKIIKEITSELIDINVPLGVYAMFKNSVVQSEDYIMKHYYNIYCIETEKNNQWIIQK